MAAQYEYELIHEMSPLHEYEWEADPFIGKAFRRIRRFAGGLAKRALPLLKRLAPIAAKLVAGAIPGVGVIAGPLAGKLVGALTQEQQHELEAILHEAAAPHPEFESQHEMEGYHPEYEGGHPEYEGYHPEFEMPSHEAMHEGYHPEYEGEHPEYEGYHPEFEMPSHEAIHEGYHPEYEAGVHEFEGEFHEYEGGHPEYEGGHPEFESIMHPEMEGGLPHSEAAHQEAMLMEQIAHEVAHTANEAEAEALAGTLVPIAIRGLRAASPAAVSQVAPALARATGRLVGALRRSPATRPLVQTVPAILRRTNAGLARAASQGVPISGRVAVRRMADETYRVFNNPGVCIHILIRSGRLRRRRIRGVR